MSRPVEHDIVVVGGGPAGAAAALHLARVGRRPLLLERHAAPRHAICGEFLSIEAQADLAALGVDPRGLGGVPIRTVRLVHGTAVAEACLPFEGVGLTRLRLDEALLARAAQAGVEVRRGIQVHAVETAGDSLGIRLDGASLAARTVFLATGKHDLKAPRRPPVAPSGALVGFKTYLALDPAQRRALGDAVEIALFDGGYAGLQRVEGERANLCLVASRRLFDRVGRRFPALLEHLGTVCRHLGARLDGAAPLLDKPLSIANVPYGFVHRPAGPEPDGLFRLGDQVAVIPSFSGDGIAIALHTGRLAAAILDRHGNAAPLYHARAARDVAGQIRLASLLHAFSQVPLGRQALLVACRLHPGALTRLAAWTRIPAEALRQAGMVADRVSP